MIVLDEQLQGRNLETLVGAWYPGSVCYITDLRPNTVIKDDAIPLLLRQQSQPTFVTINHTDFWQKTAIDEDFCMVCFTLPDTRVREVPLLLRRLLQHPEFNSKTKRMGKVIRVSDTSVSFYTARNSEVQVLDDF